jgi:hypothetical protein
MNKKLTLWLNDTVIEHAKQHSIKTGQSVSEMFANFVTALDGLEAKKDLDMDALLPITRALLGILKSDHDAR